MRRIVFRVGLFEGDRAYSEAALSVLVGALVRANEAYLRSHPGTPSFEASGVRVGGVRFRCMGSVDEWVGVEALLARGHGNGVSLACWRAAERLAAGEAVKPRVVWVPTEPGGRYHVVIDGPDGGVEDPGAVLGEAAELHAPASRVEMELGLFRREGARRYSERVLATLLGALTTANVLYLRSRAGVPPLYRAGVRYRAERYPREEWKGLGVVHEDGEGDCEDLACARAAELIVRGHAARPVFRWRRLGRLSIYHIVVRHPDGSIEDPSLVLGMGAGGATLADMGLDAERARGRCAPRARRCAKGER